MHTVRELETFLAKSNARVAELEEDVAALYRQLTTRAENLARLLPRLYCQDEIPAFDGRNEAPVDLVLTVKNTYDFLEPCLESVFANTDVPFRLFLNDNASDDPRTPALLRKVQEEHPDQVRLFLQEKDLGFTDAANLLLAETTNDVILVNADTVMPPAWASRLLWPLRYSGEKVGSSAPFTTASAMGAFPYSGISNELLPNLDTTAQDRIFQAVKPTREWTMPFAPGFCMALSRRALDEVGLLDAETYRPGHGEESDWCYRASRVGYKHVLAANLFVYHKHGATIKRMPSIFRDELIAAHNAILLQRYPSYEHDLHAFNDNPDLRALCGFLLFVASSVSGGGLHVRFVSQDTLDVVEGDVNVPVVRVAQNPETGEYRLRFRYREHVVVFTSPNLNWVIKALYRVTVTSIIAEMLPPRDEAKTRRALARLSAHMGIVPLMGNGQVIHEA